MTFQCLCCLQGGYALTLTLPESDRYFDDKLDILERNGLGSSATFNIVRGEDPPVEMMGFLRLMQLQGEQMVCKWLVEAARALSLASGKAACFKRRCGVECYYMCCRQKDVLVAGVAGRVGSA